MPSDTNVVSVGPSGKEHHTSSFIQRCVAAITGKSGSIDPSKKGELGRAFAICTATQKKSPEAAKEKTKEGVPETRVKEFEAALKKGREARKKAEESIAESGWGRRYTRFPAAPQRRQKYMFTVVVESTADVNKTKGDIGDAIGRIKGVKVVEIHTEKD